MQKKTKLRVPVSKYSTQRQGERTEVGQSMDASPNKKRANDEASAQAATRKPKKRVSFVELIRMRTDPSFLQSRFSPHRRKQQDKPAIALKAIGRESMPLVKIDLIKEARKPDEIRKVANVVQMVLEKDFNAPKHDRYQIITQHEPYEMICEDTGLG